MPHDAQKWNRGFERRCAGLWTTGAPDDLGFDGCALRSACSGSLVSSLAASDARTFFRGHETKGASDLNCFCAVDSCLLLSSGSGADADVPLCPGEEPPRGRAAVGWRVGVFWKEDWRFYDGTVTNYNTGTGRHDISYDDGELENLSLSSEKVIWKLPPGVNSKGKSQDAARLQGKRANAQRKRGQQPRSKKIAATGEPAEVGI